MSVKNRSDTLRIARLWVAGAEESEEGRRIAQELLDTELGRRYHSDEINRLAKAVGALGETSTDVVSKALELISARPEARQKLIHEHDCPTAWAFFNKHGLGSKLPPSCLVCGQAPADVEDIAIRHMELPNIIVCLKCRDSAPSPLARREEKS